MRAVLGGTLQSPAKSLVSLNMKFNGSQSCAGESCHGAANPAAATSVGNLPPPSDKKPSGPLVDFAKNLADARAKIHPK